MKKIISALSAMVLLASSAVTPVSVSAASCIAFEIESVATTGAVVNGKLAKDETVLVPVKVTENSGMSSLLLEFTYADEIQPTGIKKGRSDSDFAERGPFTENKETWARILWLENLCEDVTICGTLVKLEIKVPAGTPVGKYEIGFNEDEIQLTNRDFDSLDFDLTPGYIEVVGDSAPAVTSAPQPAQTTAATTTKKPAVTTTAKTTTAAKETTTVSEKSSESTSTTKRAAAQNNESKAEAEEAAVTTTNKAPSAPENTIGGAAGGSDAAEEIVSGNPVTDISEAAVTEAVSDTSAEAVSADNSADSKSSGDKKSSRVDNKADKSPSTGATGVVVPAVLLAVSSAGVIIAASKGKKNK